MTIGHKGGSADPITEWDGVMDFGESAPCTDRSTQVADLIILKYGPRSFGFGCAPGKKESTEQNTDCVPEHSERGLHYPGLEFIFKVIGNLSEIILSLGCD